MTIAGVARGLTLSGAPLEVARGLTLSGAPLGVAALLVVGLGPAVLAVTTVLVAPAALFCWPRSDGAERCP